jgi:hypothetical protein
VLLFLCAGFAESVSIDYKPDALEIIEKLRAYRHTVLNLGTTRLIRRGDLSRARAEIDRMDGSKGSHMSLRIDFLVMSRTSNNYVLIKEILSTQKEWMRGLERDDCDRDRSYAEYFYYKAQNEWGEYCTESELNTLGLRKATTCCRKALTYARKIYPEKSETVARLVNPE